MAVGDELSGLPSRLGEAQSVDEVVETGFQNLHEVGSGDLRAIALGDAEETLELLFADAVGEAKLLLLGHLDAVFGLLLGAGVAVLAGDGLPLLKLLAASEDGVSESSGDSPDGSCVT